MFKLALWAGAAGWADCASLVAIQGAGTAKRAKSRRAWPLLCVGLQFSVQSLFVTTQRARQHGSYCLRWYIPDLKSWPRRTANSCTQHMKPVTNLVCISVISDVDDVKGVSERHGLRVCWESNVGIRYILCCDHWVPASECDAPRMDIATDTELTAEAGDAGHRADASAAGALADTLDFSLFDGVHLNPGAREIAERIYSELLPQLRAEQGSGLTVRVTVRLGRGPGFLAAQ